MDDDSEGLNQLKFSLDYNGTLIRCMFDRIIVDHYNKTVQPIDLKTTGKAEEKFEDSVLHWNYYIQANMYTYILAHILSSDEYYKDFTILPFKFIVINKFTRTPIIWKYPLQIDGLNITDPNEQMLLEHGFKD